jgi:hypothetical protein
MRSTDGGAAHDRAPVVSPAARCGMLSDANFRQSSLSCRQSDSSKADDLPRIHQLAIPRGSRCAAIPSSNSHSPAPREAL